MVFAAGVILVYFGRVMFLGATFSGPVCNAGVTVVLACIAYVLSKAEKEKAKKSEVGDDETPVSFMGSFQNHCEPMRLLHRFSNFCKS